MVTKTLGELLGHEENNIRYAETIFLFAELLGERTTWDNVNAILSNYYQGYSSPLFVEYTGLLNKYHTLKGHHRLSNQLGRSTNKQQKFT